jgi:hypothetical protein
MSWRTLQAVVVFFNLQLGEYHPCSQRQTLSQRLGHHPVPLMPAVFSMPRQSHPDAVRKCRTGLCIAKSRFVSGGCSPDV